MNLKRKSPIKRTFDTTQNVSTELSSESESEGEFVCVNPNDVLQIEPNETDLLRSEILELKEKIKQL